MKNVKVFISYSHEDNEFVEFFTNELKVFELDIIQEIQGDW